MVLRRIELQNLERRLCTRSFRGFAIEGSSLAHIIALEEEKGSSGSCHTL
jgi:hypothetical protein